MAVWIFIQDGFLVFRFISKGQLKKEGTFFLAEVCKLKAFAQKGCLFHTY